MARGVIADVLRRRSKPLTAKDTQVHKEMLKPTNLRAVDGQITWPISFADSAAMRRPKLPGRKVRWPAPTRWECSRSATPAFLAQQKSAPPIVRNGDSETGPSFPPAQSTWSADREWRTHSTCRQ